MIFFIIAAIILVLFIGFLIALCLCKESINWRSQKYNYDLEQTKSENKQIIYKMIANPKCEVSINELW